MATRTISNTGGNWNAIGTWVEGVIPTSADDIYATATSGPLTVSATGSARSLDLTDYTNTFTMSAALTLGTTTARPDFVMLKFSPTTTLAGTSTLTCGGTYTANFVTIDVAGKTLPFATTYNTNGRWKFVSAYIGAIGNAISHTNGYLDFNNQDVTLQQMSGSGNTVRTLAMGTGTLSLGAVQISGTNLTLTGPPANVIATWFLISHPGLTFGTVTLPSTGARVCSGPFTCANLIRTGTSTASDSFWMGGVITVTGTLTVTDNSGTGLWMGPGGVGANSPVSGSSATIDLGTTGTAVLSGVDFTDMTFIGTNTPVTGTRLGDGLGNSGIVFDASRTLYWVGGIGNWSDSAHWSLASGGAGGQPCPKPQDDVVFDNSSFSAISQTATANYSRLGRNVTFKTTTPSSCRFGAAGTFHIFGSYAWGGNAVPVSSTSLVFRGRGSHTIESLPGGTVNIVAGTMTVDSFSGTYTLNSDVTPSSSGGVVLTSGTLRCSTYTLTSGFLGDTGSAPRTFDLGTGRLLSTGSSAVSFGTTAAGFTLLGTGTVRAGSSGTCQLKSNGQVVPNLLVQTTGSTQLLDNLTAGTITHTGGSLDLQGRVVICSSFTSSGSTTRALLMGGSPSLTVNGPLVLSGANLTVTAGASTVTVVGGPLAANGLTFNLLTLRPPAVSTDRLTVEAPGFTAASLTVDGVAAQHGAVVLQGNVAVTNTLTVTGQSAGNPVFVYGPDWGGQATVSAAVTTLSNATFNRIAPSGTGSWTGTNVAVADDGWRQAIAIT